MGERRFWFIQLHPYEDKNPNWYSDYGFQSGLEAIKYFLNKGVIGLGTGWDFNENGDIVSYIDIDNEENFRGDLKRFCEEIRKGDIVFTWYKGFEAILMISDDNLYHMAGVLDKNSNVQNHNKTFQAGTPLRDVTSFILSINGIKGIDFVDYPYDDKIWFWILRKVKILWQSDSSIINYRARGTFKHIGQQWATDKIMDIIKEVLVIEKVNEIKDTMHNTGLNQIILYGPPGSGKTYLAREVALEIVMDTLSCEWIINKVDENLWKEFISQIDGKELETKQGSKFRVEKGNNSQLNVMVKTKEGEEKKVNPLTINMNEILDFLKRCNCNVKNVLCPRNFIRK